MYFNFQFCLEFGLYVKKGPPLLKIFEANIVPSGVVCENATDCEMSWRYFNVISHFSAWTILVATPCLLKSLAIQILEMPTNTLGESCFRFSSLGGKPELDLSGTAHSMLSFSSMVSPKRSPTILLELIYKYTVDSSLLRKAPLAESPLTMPSCLSTIINTSLTLKSNKLQTLNSIFYEQLEETRYA